MQALVRPDDIVLVDRNCHKSHHYGLVLAGAQVAYLDSLSARPVLDVRRGAAPPHQAARLLDFRQAGTLDRVQLVLLTNCTFDGIVYDVERVMMECLAIKPDLVFLWDEAWFAFARCHPIYRQRTGMASAAQAVRDAAGPGLREAPRRVRARASAPEAGTTTSECSTRGCCPTRRKARVRVYATHCTHKTLTALRQGSMIHVWDQDFKDKAEEAFHEAYMTHTSTSPNYQILASLDVGRRQVELEGYELVQRQLELAMSLREQVLNHPLLKRYFRFLRVGDVVPPRVPRVRRRAATTTSSTGWNNLEAALAHRRVRARSDARDAVDRRHRHRRRHLQEQVPDGQVRHPDQQDLAQHRAVHDQHRHARAGGGLPDRGAGEDRARRRRSASPT